MCKRRLSKIRVLAFVALCSAIAVVVGTLIYQHVMRRAHVDPVWRVGGKARAVFRKGKILIDGEECLTLPEEVIFRHTIERGYGLSTFARDSIDFANKYDITLTMLELLNPKLRFAYRLNTVKVVQGPFHILLDEKDETLSIMLGDHTCGVKDVKIVQKNYKGENLDIRQRFDLDWPLPMLPNLAAEQSDIVLGRPLFFGRRPVMTSSELLLVPGDISIVNETYTRDATAAHQGLSCQRVVTVDERTCTLLKFVLSPQSSYLEIRPKTDGD